MATNQNKEFVQNFMLGEGLLNKHFEESFVKIPAMRQHLKPIFIFPILSLLSLCHNNHKYISSISKKKKKKKKKNTQKNKHTIFVEASAMNISEKV